jgi:hypothetical protein
MKPSCAELLTSRDVLQVLLHPKVRGLVVIVRRTYNYDAHHQYST